MGSESNLDLSALRELARAQGVEPTDEDLERASWSFLRARSILSRTLRRDRAERLRASAETVERLTHRGRTPTRFRRCTGARRARGPLYGAPVAVKDVIDVAGMPTTAASKILDDVPERDATVVARLRAAGATIVGKTNTHEFAYGAITNSPHFGPARNPWDPEHITGGSSGGSAAAAPPGSCAGALGTDTAGSIRIPSALCGITGLRPSTGLVPNDGSSRPLELRRGRPDRADRRGVRAAARGDRRPGAVSVATAPARLRIGVGHEPVRARRPPRRGGWSRRRSRELPAPGRVEARSRSTTRSRRSAAVMLPEAAAVHLPWMRTRLADYGADVRARLLAGLLLPSTAYSTGLRARAGRLEECERVLGGYDLLVAPAMPIVAPRIGEDTSSCARGLPAPSSRTTRPGACSGYPAASVPCGFVDGLPVGLALDGRRLGEDDRARRRARVPAGDGLARAARRLTFEARPGRLYTSTSFLRREGVEPACPF